MLCVMKFEWSDSKNRSNKEKHGVSFEEAREVFDDPLQEKGSGLYFCIFFDFI